MQGAPLVVPLCSNCADFEGLPPALGVSVFDSLVIEGVVDPVARLLVGRAVRQCAYLALFLLGGPWG